MKQTGRALYILNILILFGEKRKLSGEIKKNLKALEEQQKDTRLFVRVEETKLKLSLLASNNAIYARNRRTSRTPELLIDFHVDLRARGVL